MTTSTTPKVLLVCLVSYLQTTPLTTQASWGIRRGTDQNGQQTTNHECSETFRQNVLRESGCEEWQAISCQEEDSVHDVIRYITSDRVNTVILCDPGIMDMGAPQCVKDLKDEVIRFTRTGGRTIFTFNCSAHVNAMDYTDIWAADFEELNWLGVSGTDEALDITRHGSNRPTCDPWLGFSSQINDQWFRTIMTPAEHAIYVRDDTSDLLEEDLQRIEPGQVRCGVAFAKFGNGSIGFVGDAELLYRDTTNVHNDTNAGRLVGVLCTDAAWSWSCTCPIQHVPIEWSESDEE